MKPQIKAYKQKIDLYFGNVAHSVHTIYIEGRPLFHIEYEDFLNEKHVTESLRDIIGKEVMLNVKRDCSDKLMEEIYLHYGKNLSQLELCTAMSEYEA